MSYANFHSHKPPPQNKNHKRGMRPHQNKVLHHFQGFPLKNLRIDSSCPLVGRSDRNPTIIPPPSPGQMDRLLLSADKLSEASSRNNNHHNIEYRSGLPNNLAIPMHLAHSKAPSSEHYTAGHYSALPHRRGIW